MLEKIGLPPKPSLRGNNWVVDASHCQSCSSPFTFINRKHHCRRCGGLFCNGCTQQRMLLRGQGDSPVRICDPCKKLEEAARFEMRYGHKNRAGKGGSKLASEKEQDVLNQILGNEDKTIGSSTSSSYTKQMSTNTEGDYIERNLSIDQSGNTTTHQESLSPEDLRQQSVLEKQKYKTLKAEGKPEEALRAFKRGKELERQAAALEISLRKSRKKASSSSNFDDLQQVKDDYKASAEKIKPKEDHDLSSQLKELGWSDADLRDAEKRPATLTLEGELSSLLGEVSQKPANKKQTSSIGTSQVIALKKKALQLKRAGNVLEAKEELKKAKILERKIEEEELLGGGGSDDSDDELSSLMRSMDAEGNSRFSAANTFDANFDITKFDDLGGDGAFDVTDDDLENPDMISALKSLGWNEETVDSTENVTNSKVTPNKGYKPSPKNKLAIQRELIALKKNVLTLRRQGKIDEADAEMEKAKVLEQQLEDMNKAPIVAQKSAVSYATITSTGGLGEEDDEEEVTDKDLQDPTYLSVLENLGWKDENNEDRSIFTSTSTKQKGSNISPFVVQENAVSSSHSSSTPFAPQSTIVAESVTYRKSKSELQRELLTLKRKALALRRQGNTEEADEILENAKVLEAQLQEYEEATQGKVSIENDAVVGGQLKNTKSSPLVELHEKGVVESRDQSKIKLDIPEPQVQEHYKSNVQEPISSQANVAEPQQPMSVQQEILVHKRMALALKREGKLAEAKEELRLAKILEKREDTTSQESQSVNHPTEESVPKDPIPEKKDSSPSLVSKPKSSHDRFKLQQESLRHKRQALKLRREGKTEEADTEFELAKALETQLQEMDGHDSGGGSYSSSSKSDVRVEDFLDPQLLAALQSVGIEDARSRPQPIVEETQPSSADNVETSKSSEIKQLEEQIKGEKVKALNLKRAGKQAEALDSLRRAKLYEKKLQSLASK